MSQSELLPESDEASPAFRVDQPITLIYQVKIWVLIVCVAGMTSGLYLVLTWNGRWQAASLDGLLSGFPDRVNAWTWRSSLADLAVMWWVAIFSATIGSFINVVIYRMPRGVSLGGSGSACPQCQSPIKWYDNIPVLGWLLLGGRCRNCGGRISIRYPLIEFTALALGLCLFVFTVQTRHELWFNPQAKSVWHYWLLDRVPAHHVVTFFYLLPVQLASLAIAWTDRDHAKLPLRFYVSVPTLLVVGALGYLYVLGPWLASALRTPDWNTVSFVPTSQQWLAEYVGGLKSVQARVAAMLSGQVLGIMAGLTFGVLIWSVGNWLIRLDLRSTLLHFMLIGFVGGWLVVGCVGLLWLLELVLRFAWQRITGQTTGQGCQWFGLPYYFLITVAIAW